MRVLFSIILLLTSTMTIFSNVLKVEKIGIINLQRVIEVCYQGKSTAVKQLIEEKQKFQAQLDEIKNEITGLQVSLTNETDEVIKTELTKKIDQLRITYTELYKKRGPELERLEKSIQAPLFEEIYDIVKKIAEREGYSIVLRHNTDALFYYSVQSDMTDKVIDFIMKN